MEVWLGPWLSVVSDLHHSMSSGDSRVDLIFFLDVVHFCVGFHSRLRRTAVASQHGTDDANISPSFTTQCCLVMKFVFSPAMMQQTRI